VRFAARRDASDGPRAAAGEGGSDAGGPSSDRDGGKDVWDFENKRIGVASTVACEGSEGQPTVFELEDGVTVKNLIIAGGRAGGNGIVCKGREGLVCEGRLRRRQRQAQDLSG